MAGEELLVRGILDILRRSGLGWLAAEITADWEAAGLSMVEAADGTSEAAHQALLAADTIDRGLIVELNSANYLRSQLEQAVFRFAGQADLNDAPLQGLELDARARDADATGILTGLVTDIRQAINEEWPALTAELGNQ